MRQAVDGHGQTGAFGQAQEILESITDAFFAVDSDWRFIYVNKEAERLLRQPRDDLLGRSIWDRFPEAADSAFWDRYHDAMSTRVPVSFEEFYEPLETWFEVKAFPSANGLAVYFSDISERRAAEKNRDALLREFEALETISQAALSTLDLKDLLDAILARLTEVLGADVGAIHIRDGDDIVVRAATGMAKDTTGFRIRIGDGFAGKVAATGVSLYVRDIAESDLAVGPDIRELGIRTMLGAPLLYRGELTGVLHVDWRTVHEEDAMERRLLELAADRCVSAIEGARLLEEAVEAQRRLSEELAVTSLLLEAADAMGSSMDRSEVVSRLADIARRLSGRRRVVVSTWDPLRETLTATHITDGIRPEVGSMLTKEQIPLHLREALKEGRTTEIEIAEAGAEAGADYSSRMEQSEGKRVLAVPLMSKGKTVGLVTVDEPGDDRPFSEREKQLLEGVAAQAGVAIESTELYEREREIGRLAAALNRVNELMLSTLDSDEMLELAVMEASEGVGAEMGLVLMQEGDDWVVRYAHGFPPDIKGRRFSRSYASAWTRAASDRKPMLVPDVESDPNVNVEFARAYRMESYMLLPLVVQGELLGMLHFGWKHPQRFSDRHQSFSERLSTALSLALEGARRYEEEHRVASTLQEALLELPDDVPGLEMAHAYHSASETARVGGDFYDLFELEQGLVAVVMGDVSGKGLDAAVLTSLVRNTLRAQAFVRGNTPAEIVQKTNLVIEKRTPTEMFVTLFFGILDRRDGRLVYCNAGHTSCVLARRHPDDVAPLPPNSPFVGAFADAKFSQTETWLELADLLLLYTDGLVEARKNGQLYGEERLIEAVKEVCCDRTADVIEHVLNDVLDFVDYRLSDDLAMLAIKRQTREGHVEQQKMKLQ